MINDAITLGSFMADLMEWYCKLVEADHLQDYEIDRNYEKLNVRCSRNSNLMKLLLNTRSRL